MCVFNVLKANKCSPAQGPDVRAGLGGQPQIIHDVIRLEPNDITEAEVWPGGTLNTSSDDGPDIQTTLLTHSCSPEDQAISDAGGGLHLHPHPRKNLAGPPPSHVFLHPSLHPHSHRIHLVFTVWLKGPHTVF